MEYKRLSLKIISANLFVYGALHALIDAICAGVIFSIYKYQIVNPTSLFYFFVLYNVLAFGLQTFFGLITDYLKSPRIVAFLGCILTGVSAFIFLSFPLIAVIIAGLGNALYHVGSGSISLNLTPRKAAAPGIYVAPGALGLLAGTMLGKSGHFFALPFIVALVVFCVLMFLVKKPEMNYDKDEIKKSQIKYFEFILFLIILSIAIRSLVGMAIVFPWKTDVNLLIILTMAVVLGKAFGGVLADSFGWIRVAVGALVLSIPFLVFGANIPVLAIIGMFLFNITMPITLVAISNILPGHPGFSFGLTCLALLLGALPAFSGLKQIFGEQLIVFTIVIVSAASLYFALNMSCENIMEKRK